MHFILFYGFIIIQIGLVEIIIKGFIIGFEFPFANAHKYFSFMQEWTTFLMLCGVIYAFYHRYVEKLKRLQLRKDIKSAMVIIALITLTVSILFTLGFETVMLGHEPDFIYAPFSGVVAAVFSGIGMEAGTVLFYVFWWVHLAFVFNVNATKANQLALQASLSGSSEVAATEEMQGLIGDVITEEEVWACTTCRNCEDQCSVMNEHVEKIIDLRRYLVMTQGDKPAEASRYFQNIERKEIIV